jgi:large subunit ribosomal protein L9
MKVLLRKNVQKVGRIGDVVDVKPGYARNYLLPHNVAVVPTAGNIKAVEAEKAAYLADLARRRGELEAKAAVVNGKEVTIAARANTEGHLYGSVGPAQIVAALASETVFIDEEHLVMEPIRQLDKYELTVEFAEDITATITVWVVPIREEGDEAPAAAPPAVETAQDESEQEQAE